MWLHLAGVEKKCQYTIDAKLGEFEGQNPPIAETYKIPRKLASHEPEEGRTQAFLWGRRGIGGFFFSCSKMQDIAF